MHVRRSKCMMAGPLACALQDGPEYNHKVCR